MAEKVILVLVDGMRPDGLLQCGHPFVDTLRKNATVYLQAQTVIPSVTLLYASAANTAVNTAAQHITAINIGLFLLFNPITPLLNYLSASYFFLHISFVILFSLCRQNHQYQRCCHYNNYPYIFASNTTLVL